MRRIFPEIIEITTRVFDDQRGWFTESYNRKTFVAHGIEAEFVQDNLSYSAPEGTIRGLHYQLAPAAQAKLIRVLRGKIWDVAVDVRKGSPTFGDHMAVTLSAELHNQLFIPYGFAHGFITLEQDTEVFYKVDAFWVPDCERGIQWNDPALGIEWPLNTASPTLSFKDTLHPPLAAQTDLPIIEN